MQCHYIKAQIFLNIMLESGLLCNGTARFLLPFHIFFVFLHLCV
jgi:hypothetical protein